MGITNLAEIINLVIVTIVIGYIFSGYIKKPGFKKTSFENFKFALLITAPAILLHELGHKFVAIYFGMSAYFQIWVFGLLIALVLRFFSSPFLILAPGYVEIMQAGTPTQSVLISFAGPFVNLVLFLGAYLILKKRNLKRKTMIVLYLTKMINLWLFIFNMLPIPPLDGSKVFGYLLGFY